MSKAVLDWLDWLWENVYTPVALWIHSKRRAGGNGS